MIQPISHQLDGKGTLGERLEYLQKSQKQLYKELSFILKILQVKQQEDPNAPNVAQPDNAEQRLKLLNRKEESCLALATNLWQSDTVWNDIACYHQKEWICEDSDSLLKAAGLV